MRASYGVRVKGRFAVFTLLTPRRARQKLGITCTKAGKIIYNVTEKFARIADNSRNNAILNATKLVNSICGQALLICWIALLFSTLNPLNGIHHFIGCHLIKFTVKYILTF